MEPLGAEYPLAHMRDLQHAGIAERLTAAIAAHELNPSWGIIQDVEDCFEYMSTPPLSPEEASSEDVLTVEEENSDVIEVINTDEIDALMRNTRPESALSALGDGDVSTSSDSPPSDTPNSISRPLSPISPDSPESTMGPSDCENQPVSPCQSPCYSRPGSPWPMYARPSFKKTRSPFWTTFRARDFR